MPTWFLFFGPSLIWGTTWFVIKLQLGVVAAEASVVYRFALASLMLFAGCAATRVSLRFDARTHARLAVLGFFQYAMNYVLVYSAEKHVASGLVAVIFASMVALNLVGARVFFGRRIEARVAAGGALGMGGVGLVFGREIARASGADVGLGVALALGAVVVASIGNLWSERVYRSDLAVAPTSAWAMLYATLMIAAYCALRGVPFAFDPSPRYVASLLYLALFGSVLAFLGYLTLLRKIGAGRASYTAVVIPVIAMLLSTALEGYQWSATAALGMGLVVAGNVLVLRQRVSCPSRPERSTAES